MIHMIAFWGERLFIMFQQEIEQYSKVWWLSKLAVVLACWNWHFWKIPQPASLAHLYCKIYKIEQFNHVNICMNVLKNSVC